MSTSASIICRCSGTGGGVLVPLESVGSAPGGGQLHRPRPGHRPPTGARRGRRNQRSGAGHSPPERASSPPKNCNPSTSPPEAKELPTIRLSPSASRADNSNGSAVVCRRLGQASASFRALGKGTRSNGSRAPRAPARASSSQVIARVEGDAGSPEVGGAT